MHTRFEGVAALRRLFDDFIAPYEEYRVEPEEILDLGNAVTFSVIVQHGRFVGSTGSVRMRMGAVTTWVDGLITRNSLYPDVDEARAAAERLAEERG